MVSRVGSVPDRPWLARLRNDYHGNDALGRSPWLDITWRGCRIGRCFVSNGHVERFSAHVGSRSPQRQLGDHDPQLSILWRSRDDFDGRYYLNSSRNLSVNYVSCYAVSQLGLVGAKWNHV